MANNTLKTRIVLNNHTSTEWASDTYKTKVPLKGEVCIYSDLRKIKIGDGSTTITDLSFAYMSPEEIQSIVAASDAMVFKGTLGTNGTVTFVPTDNVVKGDTYKIVTAGTWAGSSCKVGDLIIALNSGKKIEANTTNWAYVPSGNENETTIKYSTTTQNLTTTAQTGSITLAEGATKQVDSSISKGSTSKNLPTSAAVASFVEDKGYVTTDTQVKNECNNTVKAYVTGTTSATTNTGTQVFDTGVYLDTVEGKLVATSFAGNLTGNVTGNVSGSSGSCTGNSATSTKLSNARNIGITGAVTGTATSFDGSKDININTTSLNAAKLTLSASDTLILDGNFSDE